MGLPCMQSRTNEPNSRDHRQLEVWVGKAPGLQLTDRVTARAEPIVDQAVATSGCNMACFQATASLSSSRHLPRATPM